jgi:ubiquinone/menaquinone biosynthesis C-methylase UbiE
MKIAADYNAWAGTYDQVVNKTRDLEGLALRTVLSDFHFDSILEAGCGTGKNTSFLAKHAGEILSVDFSHEMLTKARQKNSDANVKFLQCDLNQPWPFPKNAYDLVSFSLVLEHFHSLSHVFQEAFNGLRPGGKLYIGELHPFKQYAGSKARFETATGEVKVLDCFTHHIADYFDAANSVGFQFDQLKEWFDTDRYEIPRVLTIVFIRP